MIQESVGIFLEENMFHTLVHLTSFCGSLDPIDHGSEKLIRMAAFEKVTTVQRTHFPLP